jgi:signal transduction histidine kinase
MALAISINSKDLINENSLFQSMLYSETNDYEKSLFFYEQYDTCRDSIFTIEGGSKIAELQVRHKMERQFNELDLLQKDNDIQQLHYIKQQSLLLYLGGFALATGLFILVILHMFRHMKSLNLELQENTRQLENANGILLVTEKNLQKLNLTKDKFFAIIAHDLKNPLNALLGFSETLNSNYNDLTREQVLTYINIIKKSAKSLYQLLENLLEWSKSQTGNIHFNPENFKLKEIAEIVVNTLAGNAKRKNIKINLDVDSGITLYTDKNLVSSILRNLVGNAVKFSFQDGEILISAHEKENQVEISVSDTGIGIGAGDKKKLFDLDYNFTTAGTNDEKGTGLGLILCREFAEKCGGIVWVDSEAGKGSTFTFTIPS